MNLTVRDGMRKPCRRLLQRHCRRCVKRCYLPENHMLYAVVPNAQLPLCKIYSSERIRFLVNLSKRHLPRYSYGFPSIRLSHSRQHKAHAFHQAASDPHTHRTRQYTCPHLQQCIPLQALLPADARAIAPVHEFHRRLYRQIIAARNVSQPLQSLFGNSNHCRRAPS